MSTKQLRELQDQLDAIGRLACSGSEALGVRGAAEALAKIEEVLNGKEQHSPLQSPVYGIIDPDYARCFTVIRKIAEDHGYAISMHGTFTKDLDLVATAWTDTPDSPAKLIAHITYVLKLRSLTGIEKYATRPGGRRVYTLMLDRMEGDPRYIDLSFPPGKPTPEHVYKGTLTDKDGDTLRLMMGLNIGLDLGIPQEHPLVTAVLVGHPPFKSEYDGSVHGKTEAVRAVVRRAADFLREQQQEGSQDD